MRPLASLAFLLLASTSLRAQTLTGSNLVLTGPSNSQLIGGAGTNGDASCPVLANLTAGQFATCYFSRTGTWELGYAGSTYSPIARMSDLQTTQTALQTSVSTMQNSVSGTAAATTALQSTISTLQTSVSSIQLTSTALQSNVSTLQGSVSSMQTSLSTLQNQVSGSQNSQSPQPNSPATMLDVVSTGPLSLGLGFNTIVVATVIQDTASAFNRQTGVFTVPSSGTYLCVGKLRLADGIPAQISYGLGVGTTNADLPGFLWFATNQVSNGWNRHGAANTSVNYYSAGQQIRMYAYVDATNPLPISWAELTIVKLGQ